MENLERTYQTFVARRAKKLLTPLMDTLHGAVGACGEAGELLDEVKKCWIYGKTINRENILEEVGDQLFYLQHVLTVTGYTLAQALEANMLKLEKRYPDGYSDAAAIARADKA